ncbi:hypothetical protein P168DRAFT_288953 [Aspergillus campestris IBT 28561]|uniref:Mitochondrial carrier protein PET8 n=1 Tax=Aspergillus campestris (strain IBT 28561) TaxID=1392248 RepID=A0A2I1D6K1_ASPC2|nr:uncharacterized protein P168DRAFT_288953 [Aspergillus campestris IBT 28561]PKY05489.1 hypothetical protein P168DRAFT_288953 [Aspergillus campestris IBT 28561]
MSFLAPTVRASLRALRPQQGYAVLSSPLHTTAARPGLKESDHNRENLDVHYEEEKEEGLQRKREGRGQWKGELASNSEASIKADRGDLDSEDITTLQEKTKKELHSTKKQK